MICALRCHKLQHLSRLLAEHSQVLERADGVRSFSPGTAIFLGGILLSARRAPVICTSDRAKVKPTRRRLWLRITNTSSSRRKLSQDSLRILRIFERWLSFIPPLCSMRPPPQNQLETCADASASGAKCAAGGFVHHPSLGQIWFSETFYASDFHALGVPVRRDMFKYIASYEALAQGGLILAGPFSCHAVGCLS